MTDAKKCANPACTCTPSDKDKFCSAHCEACFPGVPWFSRTKKRWDRVPEVGAPSGTWSQERGGR
jgi:hypothetical protein